MATLEDLRRLSLALPGAEEVTYKGDPWFNVGRKTFALFTRGRAILKLDKGHQELLFEVRPETFEKCKVATVFWSWVELAHLDAAELEELVVEAWSQIVPKKVSRPVLAGRPSRGTHSDRDRHGRARPGHPWTRAAPATFERRHSALSEPTARLGPRHKAGDDGAGGVPCAGAARPIWRTSPLRGPGP